MKEMLIFVDTVSNKNKYYQLELIGDMVHAEYGRVGSSPQKRSYAGGQRMYDKKKNEKLRKGYVASEIDLGVIEESTSSTGNIMDIAMSQIKTDDVSKKLIEKLVEQNIHNITSNTKIKYDIKTGYFKTDLGIVTQKGVDKALGLLVEMGKYMPKMGELPDADWKRFVRLNEQYFTIIPTKISNLRDHRNLLITEKKILAQTDICNSLADSLKIIEDEKQKIKDGNKASAQHEQIFEASVFELTDKKEYNRLVKYFNDTKNSRHGRDANSYNVEKIYRISLGKEEEEYRDDLANQMELFHGTKVANLLSILKSGLLMPKYSPGQVTGYMFGQGLYFANQSTKSLNYCDGMYWNNSKRTDKIYMFIADIAMGNYQIPSSSRSKKPDSGYDSYWAQPGKSGIQNDEMIIFNNNQIKLKYILEISK